MGNNKSVIPILEKRTNSTNVLRGRDVRATLSGRNLDPLLIDTLCTMAEVLHTNLTSTMEMANQQAQIIDIVQKFADISANMKDKMTSIQQSIDGDMNDSSSD